MRGKHVLTNPGAGPVRRTTSIAALSAVLMAVSLAVPAGASATPPATIAVPSLDSAPVGIAAGPGGTMWFVENTGFAVGRVDSAGHLTEFAVPANSAGSHGSLNSITAGPDGAMWFTDESSANPRVGRIDPASGAMTMYELPTGAGAFAGAQPLQITAGSDGALWFTGFFGSVIGRVDVAGHFTAYPLRRGGDVRGITAGPDGAIWFTQVTPDAVGRLDPTTGAVVLHKVHSPLGTAAPIGIATGPDGDLWFTEFGHQRHRPARPRHRTHRHHQDAHPGRRAARDRERPGRWRVVHRGRGRERRPHRSGHAQGPGVSPGQRARRADAPRRRRRSRAVDQRDRSRPHRPGRPGEPAKRAGERPRRSRCGRAPVCRPVPGRPAVHHPGHHRRFADHQELLAAAAAGRHPVDRVSVLPTQPGRVADPAPAGGRPGAGVRSRCRFRAGCWGRFLCSGPSSGPLSDPPTISP